MWTEHRLISFDETALFYRRCTAPARTDGVVILLHGMGEHGGRYEEFARFLAGKNLESIVPDLRGFGRSGGKRACVRRFSDFHEDLHTIHAWVERTQKGSPIFLLGHSFGGLIASSYVAFRPHPRLTGLVLSSPIFGIASRVPLWRHLLGMVCSYLAPDYRQGTKVRAETLTHDPEIIGRYKKDPYIYHRISARLYRELNRLIRKRRQIAGRISLPVLVAQAGEDLVVDKEKTASFFNSLASLDKELEIYPGTYHEILNEVKRETVFSRIAQWITGHIKL